VGLAFYLFTGETKRWQTPAESAIPAEKNHEDSLYMTDRSQIHHNNMVNKELMARKAKFQDAIDYILCHEKRMPQYMHNNL